MKKANQKSKSTVRHTRAIQADRQKRPLVDNLTAEVEALFHSLVHPLALWQCDLFRQMGLRERTLTLLVMRALLLSAVWRQIAAVNELARLIRDEAVLWEEPKQVSQQAHLGKLAALLLACLLLSGCFRTNRLPVATRSPDVTSVPVSSNSALLSSTIASPRPDLIEPSTLPVTVTDQSDSLVDTGLSNEATKMPLPTSTPFPTATPMPTLIATKSPTLVSSPGKPLTVASIAAAFKNPDSGARPRRPMPNYPNSTRFLGLRWSRSSGRVSSLDNNRGTGILFTVRTSNVTAKIRCAPV